MRTHLKIVGALWVLLGALFVVNGVAAVTVLAGIGWLTGREIALVALGWLGAMLALSLAVLGLPLIVVGGRLYRAQRSARTPAIVLAILLALTGGAGVLVAAYMLWVLFDGETRALFGDPARRALAAT